MAKKEKPIVFKRHLNRNTVEALYVLVSAEVMGGSPQEMDHRARLQSDLLKLYPELLEGAKTDPKEKRTIEIDRRQMRALIYGGVFIVQNFEQRVPLLYTVWVKGVDLYQQIKGLYTSLGIWEEVQKIIKPDDYPEWDGEIGDDMDIPEEGPADTEEATGRPAPVPHPAFEETEATA